MVIDIFGAEDTRLIQLGEIKLDSKVYTKPAQRGPDKYQRIYRLV